MFTCLYFGSFCFSFLHLNSMLFIFNIFLWLNVQEEIINLWL